MASFKILDGAMGSELIKRGITLPKHIWSADSNLRFPELVLQINREYVEAGADYITANTFRATPRAYQKTQNNNEKSNHMANTSLSQAVKIAKKAAKESTLIIGSIAPLEDCYSPELFPGREIAISEFYQLGKWLTDAGVDILLLETMNSIYETRSALEALNDFDLPIWVSFVLKNEIKLLSGDTLCNTFKLLNDYNINMMLINCTPLSFTKKAVNNIVDNWHKNWGIYPNLGRGDPSPDGYIAEYETMEKFLTVIENAINNGASLVGACCGSSPEHIAELKKMQYRFV